MYEISLISEDRLDGYLTVGEAAEFLGVSSTTLRNWDRSGKLAPYRHPLNNYRLYKKVDLEKLLKNVKTQKNKSARRI